MTPHRRGGRVPPPPHPPPKHPNLCTPFLRRSKKGVIAVVYHRPAGVSIQPRRYPPTVIPLPTLSARCPRRQPLHQYRTSADNEKRRRRSPIHVWNAANGRIASLDDDWQIIGGEQQRTGATPHSMWITDIRRRKRWHRNLNQIGVAMTASARQCAS